MLLNQVQQGLLMYSLSVCNHEPYLSSDIQLQCNKNNTFRVDYLGSQAAIMFLASNICWVSSGTVRALNLKASKRVQRNESSNHGMFAAWNVTANYHLLFKCYSVCFCMGGEGSEEKAWKSFGSEVPAVTCWVTTMVIFGWPPCRGERICATGHDLCPSFCSSAFFVDPEHREIGLNRYF